MTGVKGRTQLPGMVQQYMNKQINIDDMVTHQFPLDKINEAFHLMHEGKRYGTRTLVVTCAILVLIRSC